MNRFSPNFEVTLNITDGMIDFSVGDAGYEDEEATHTSNEHPSFEEREQEVEANHFVLSDDDDDDIPPLVPRGDNLVVLGDAGYDNLVVLGDADYDQEEEDDLRFLDQHIAVVKELKRVLKIRAENIAQ